MIPAGLLAAPLPAIAADSCPPLQIITTLPITMLPSGRPGVAVKIGDAPETMLVDTGAVFSTLTLRTIHELNLSPTRTNVRLKDLRGQISDKAVRLPSITLGGLRQDNPYFQVAPGEDNPKNRQNFAGTLGPDFLQNFDADFDFAAGKLNLVSPKHCDGKVVYWNPPAVAVVPVHIAQVGHIIFPMMLDGERVTAILDTGARNTTMNLDLARRVFNVDTAAPDVRKIGDLQGGYKAAVYERRFKTLEVDGVKITDPDIVLLPDLVGDQAPRTGTLTRGGDDISGLPDLILGMSVLSKLHAYIAYKESKLYLSAGGPQGAPQTAPGP
jgi:predicted aspartyl protease